MTSSYSWDTREALRLHGEGMSNRAIGAAVGVHHYSVARLLRQSNLESNGRRRGIRLVDGENSKCSVCGEWKPTEQFPLHRQTGQYPYRLTYCQECRRTQMNEAINASPLRYLENKWQRTSVRARRLGIEFSVTKAEFASIFETQAGRCFYTDTPMLTQVGSGRSPHAASVDKIVPADGYTPGNIVFCTNQVNTIKSNMSLDEMARWTPDWHARATTYLFAQRDVLRRTA